MVEEGFKRKLTAILSADAVGYSRLMAEDETATVKTIAAYREVMTALIKQHRGRVVDSPGDNLLAEFSSVVDAVQCAVAVQNEFQTRNAELTENRRMEFRIGINLGDVIDEEDRIYGDGVNIAARLESLADPGGICVSKTAFDQIETKLPLGYEYLGEKSVKNIPKPVGAYRVLMKPDAAGKVIGEKRFLGRFSRKTAIAAIIVLLMVAGGLVGWNIYLQQSKKVKPASVEKMAFPLPDKPSIAVLPFDNLSGDAEQEYFSDGITETIIMALTKVGDIFVIARNSTFIYKGKAVKIQQVAEELGVRYVLEGSVQKTEDKLRVTAQLIDAVTGRHMWAERYDRDLKDLFALQDEITKKIITAMQVKLTVGEQARLYGKGTKNFEAYLKVLQSIEYRRRHNPEDNDKARDLAQEAIALDPHYPIAYTVLGRTHFNALALGTKSRQEELRRAEEMAKKALSLDDSLAAAYSLLGHVYSGRGEHEKAIAEYERALELDPNGADSFGRLGMGYRFADRPEEAIQMFKKAIRLNPRAHSWYYWNLCLLYQNIENAEEAIVWGEKAVVNSPKNFFAHLILTSAYSGAGRLEEARSQAAEVLTIRPKFSVARLEKRLKNSWKDKIAVRRQIEALRKAGLK